MKVIIKSESVIIDEVSRYDIKEVLNSSIELYKSIAERDKGVTQIIMSKDPTLEETQKAMDFLFNK